MFGYSAVAVGTAALLLALTDGHLPRLVRALEWRPLAHLGTVSYGAYLFHGVLAVAIAGLGLHWVASLVLLFGLTWLAATLSWRRLETPVLALKERHASYRT